MRYFVTAMFLAIAFATLSGCGQTGPLYMPTEEAPGSPVEAPAKSTEPHLKDS